MLISDSVTTTRHRQSIHVVIVALPNTSLINLFGPAEVFAEANSLLRNHFYKVQIISTSSTQCDTAFQAKLTVGSTIKDFDQEIDTLLLAGGSTWQVPVRRAERAELFGWLQANCARARRYGALCSGGILLAEAGLLRHKRATTHWSRLDEMKTRYPDVDVLLDRSYVKDGNCYTAAGGATGVDLALLMVEEDLGTEVVLEIAKKMVLFLRRSGEQPQLSATLLAQTSPIGSISNLLVWMVDNLEENLSVAQLARRVAMSPRNFARRFTQHVGKTPGIHVRDLRLEAAHKNLAQNIMSFGEVATASGFGSLEVFRRLFIRKFGISPRSYRELLQKEGTTRAELIKKADTVADIGSVA